MFDVQCSMLDLSAVALAELITLNAQRLNFNVQFKKQNARPNFRILELSNFRTSYQRYMLMTRGVISVKLRALARKAWASGPTAINGTGLRV